MAVPALVTAPFLTLNPDTGEPWTATELREWAAEVEYEARRERLRDVDVNEGETFGRERETADGE